MTDRARTVGLLGGGSPLVPYLLPRLLPDVAVTRFSRTARPGEDRTSTYEEAPADLRLDSAVSLMPIWEMPAYFDWLSSRSCQRLVAMSSTSRFTKTTSTRSHDRSLAERLARGEEAARAWSEASGVALTILRPTMVYGGAQDGNVSELTSLLRRFRCVPLVGSGAGLRQPVHMADVAAAIAHAVQQDRTARVDYDLSGGETLTYRQLLDRIRETVPGPTAVLRVPGMPFRLLERAVPGSKRVSLAAGMVERMGTDMTFDHSAASTDLGYTPRRFEPGL